MLGKLVNINIFSLYLTLDLTFTDFQVSTPGGGVCISCFSGGGGGLLHLLAPVPQPAADVRGGDPVRRVDPAPAAGDPSHHHLL